VDGAVLPKSQLQWVAARVAQPAATIPNLPLLWEADFGRGVSMRVMGPQYPQAMAFGAAGQTGNAAAFGRVTALEARAARVHGISFPM